MSRFFSSHQVLCRPALLRDYADIAEFCKGIWEQQDYVPKVWERWFQAPNSLLVTAEYSDRAIGCCRLSRLAQGDWWLEGFRVDPNYQGHEVGSLIHNYITDWWIEHCDGAVRLMTSADNRAMHHLCDRTGYVKKFEICGYSATPIDETVESFSPVMDTGEAAGFALTSESLQYTENLFDLGWRYIFVTEHALKDCTGKEADFIHSLYWWKNKNGLCSIRSETKENKRNMVIGLLACRLKDVAPLLVDIRRFAALAQFDQVHQVAIDLPQFTSQLNAAGYAKCWDQNAFLFEKKHPGRL